MAEEEKEAEMRINKEEGVKRQGDGRKRRKDRDERGRRSDKGME